MASPTDAIKERIDLVALISEYLPLKRTGANFKARCPFHEEDTPSFIVSPSRQMFHCFGCSKSGDCFTWLMEREGMSFPEALRVLAQRAGIPLTFEHPERREERERLRATLDLAATFYQRVLTETAEGGAARAYLEGRGLTPDTVAAWRLGFCPPTATRIVEKAQEREVAAGDLIRAGIVGERDGRRFEFFHGRILFPLTDHHGSVVGLAGRVFAGERADAPKYLNSPETVLYLKSKVLYGLDRAKEAIRRENLAVLVEGYTDVIASHQAGALNVVATAGTALTDDHLRLLRRFADRLAFAFDADAAGAAATRRAVDLALAAGFTVSVVLLPAGEDPADLAVRDADAWQAALGKREDVFPFLLRRARALHAAATPEGKRAIAGDLLPLIAGIPDAVVQGDYVQQLAVALRVDARFVYDDLRRFAQQETRNRKRETPLSTINAQPSTPPVDPQLRREERFLLLLLAELSLIEKVAVQLPADAFTVPETRALYAALTAWYARGRAVREDTRSRGPDESSRRAPRPALAELRGVLSEDLRQRMEVLLLAVETEREAAEWRPAKEAEVLLQALLLAHVRRELQVRTDRLRSAHGAERVRLLQEVSAMTAELARAERATLSS